GLQAPLPGACRRHARGPRTSVGWTTEGRPALLPFARMRRIAGRAARVQPTKSDDADGNDYPFPRAAGEGAEGGRGQLLPFARMSRIAGRATRVQPTKSAWLAHLRRLDDRRSAGALAFRSRAADCRPRCARPAYEKRRQTET